MSIFGTFVELAVNVEYDYTPEEHGHRDRFGVPEEPDYPADIEITKVMVGNVDILELITKDQEDRIESDIWADQPNAEKKT